MVEHRSKKTPQVCAYSLQKYDIPKPLLLYLRLAHLVLPPPAPSVSQPAVQINNKELKWRTETSPMAAQGKSSSNYTTKHSLGFFCLTAAPLPLLLLLNSAYLAPQSLHRFLPLSWIFNHHVKQLNMHFSHLLFVMWNKDSYPSTSTLPITTWLLFSWSAVFPFIRNFFLLAIPLSLISPIDCCLVITVSPPLFHHLEFALHISANHLTTNEARWLQQYLPLL